MNRSGLLVSFTEDLFLVMKPSGRIKNVTFEDQSCASNLVAGAAFFDTMDVAT